MFIRTKVDMAAAQTRKGHFWLSVVVALSFDLLVYHQALVELFPVESLRLTMAFFACLLLLLLICFYLFDRVLVPRFVLFAKPQKNTILSVAILTPLVLAVAILDRSFQTGFLDIPVYFLLPAHTVRIEALPEGLENGGEVVLTGIYTKAQGAISYKTLETQGWERRGNHLVLTDPAGNYILWKGKTGESISLTFWAQPNTSRIRIHWDDAEKDYDLFSALPENMEIEKKFFLPIYSNRLPLVVAAYVSAAFAVFLTSVLLTAFPGFAAVSKQKRNTWIIYALPMYATWFLFLLVFWPGIMSPDSMSQWEQIVTGQFVHAHPVAHTLTMWLITRVWFSPAAVAVVQILVLGGILGWGIASLREQGYPQWLAWMTAIGLAIMPANPTLSITLWKDVLFSAVVVALTIMFFKIVASKGDWLVEGFNWLWLGVIFLLVSLYRQNGLFVSSLSLLAVGFVYVRFWKSMLKAGILFLSVYFLLNGPIFRVINVQVANMARGELVVAHLLSGHMEAQTPAVLESRELLGPVMTEYPWPYTCYRNSRLLFYSDMDRGYLAEHFRELLSLALKATAQNPVETLNHFACQGASVYRIVEDYPYAGEWMFEIVENGYGLKLASALPDIHSRLLIFIGQYIRSWNRNPTVWFFWRMPFWMYLSVLGCIIFCIRNKEWKPLVILLPGLVTVLPYLILTLGQIFRYLYSMYLIGILFSGYFFTGTFQAERRDSFPVNEQTGVAKNHLL